MSKWTRFMDMHSGGDAKRPPYEYIFIEAPEEEALTIFKNVFNRDPDHVTCECCGSDYSYCEHDDLAQATAFDRDCLFENGRYVEKVRGTGRHLHYTALEDYLKRSDVFIIRASDIKDVDRIKT